MAFRLLAVLPLALLPVSAQQMTDDTTSTSSSSSSITWWPNPPFTTETYGPIVPSYGGHQAPTTSLTAIPSYTYTSSPGTSLPSVSPNATSSSAPYPTGNSTTLPACKKIQYDFPAGTGGNAERAAAVADAYRYAWNAYNDYAFGKDQLLPLNASYVNNWYGWGVTIVDGIDTAVVMGLTDIVEKELAFIQTIDFSTTTYGPVETFDTNIRYLGGLLSTYDLLKSGLFANTYDQTLVDALLSQAIVLADKLAFVFDTPSGLAATNVNFTSDAAIQGTYTVEATGVTYNSTNTASAGTFILEFFRLSDLTGNETYRQLAERGESYLVNPSPVPVYPGLVGTQFDSDTGAMLTFDGGWHSGVDSFLEYLIKSYHYKVDAATTQYKDFWLQAVQSTVEYIALHPYGFPDVTFLSALDVNGSLQWTSDDYTCFAGGNFLLGAQVLDMPDLIPLGIATTDGCHLTYNSTLTGLGPIEWSWYNASNLAYDPLDDNDTTFRKFAAKYGFYIDFGDEEYASFPETIESIFYSYRITGDERFQEYAWQIFEAINNTARNDIAYASVNNVNMPFGGSMSNELDSFFFAEVLKYLYLIFADPSVVDLGQFVFNTECHPFLVQCGIGAIDDFNGTTVSSNNTSTAAR